MIYPYELAFLSRRSSSSLDWEVSVGSALECLQHVEMSHHDLDAVDVGSVVGDFAVICITPESVPVDSVQHLPRIRHPSLFCSIDHNGGIKLCGADAAPSWTPKNEEDRKFDCATLADKVDVHCQAILANSPHPFSPPFSYQGESSQQHPMAARLFRALCRRISPCRIVEIGTGGGGLTLFLLDLMVGATAAHPMRSYDIIERRGYHILRERGADIRIVDVFQSPQEMDELIDTIRKPGTSLVLCDGGSKCNEFRVLAGGLKAGDCIMAHDYAFDLDTFETSIRGKVWNWREIVEADIANTCAEHGLVPIMQDEFAAVAWACRIKG